MESQQMFLYNLTESHHLLVMSEKHVIIQTKQPVHPPLAQFYRNLYRPKCYFSPENLFALSCMYAISGL